MKAQILTFLKRRAILLLIALVLLGLLALGAKLFEPKSQMKTFYRKYNHVKVVLEDLTFDIYKGEGDAEVYDWGRCVWKDGKCYRINDGEKAMEVSKDQFFPEDIYLDVGDMKRTATGKGGFEGKQLDSETFEDEDWKQTYYFDADGGLKGYVVVDKEAPDEVYKSIQVLSYDNDVPKGVFDIPSDYKIVEAETAEDTAG